MSGAESLWTIKSEKNMNIISCSLAKKSPMLISCPNFIGIFLCKTTLLVETPMAYPIRWRLKMEISWAMFTRKKQGKWWNLWYLKFLIYHFFLGNSVPNKCWFSPLISPGCAWSKSWDRNSLKKSMRKSCVRAPMERDFPESKKHVFPFTIIYQYVCKRRKALWAYGDVWQGWMLFRCCFGCRSNHLGFPRDKFAVKMQTLRERRLNNLLFRILFCLFLSQKRMFWQ